MGPYRHFCWVSIKLGWLPGQAPILAHLVLPAITMGSGWLPILTRMVRTAMLKSWAGLYPDRRAKGLPERTVLYRQRCAMR